MTDWPHQLTISGTYSSDTASMIAESLRPEMADLGDERSQTWISHYESDIELTVEARDLIALRAAMNTWMNLVRVAESTASQKRRD